MRWLSVMGALLMAAPPACRSAAEGASPNPGTPWPATDALGRALPVAPSVKAARPGRTVGMFYFLTHGDDLPGAPGDISRILPQDPDILRKPDSPLWGGHHSFYWGEPLYGYYKSTDPWVLRRHANLLADAGVDVAIFDTTNRRTYPEVYSVLCKVWAHILAEGGRAPRICFMVNTQAGETAREIYRDLYQPGLCKELWFVWQGKPLMICDPAEAGPELRQFFTLRAAHWPFTLTNTHNRWHWESTFPQVFSFDQAPGAPEQVNVAVAQNLRASDGKVTNMSERNARGRSFHDGKMDTSPGAVNHGFNFAEQWRRAIELDPPFVMVTGWNEWTAGKFSRPGLPVVFVDQFDQQYSRDIEPVTGLHRDNYYYQLAANIRLYKGAPGLPPASPPKSIQINGDFSQWAAVEPDYSDHAFDNDLRDCKRGALHFQNSSGRNDLVRLRVSRDRSNLFFYAQTRGTITPASGTNWMWLLIDADQNPATGWAGYDFILNRSIEGGETWLEKNTGGWNWQRLSRVQFRVQGNELMLAVPRAALGLTNTTDLRFDFKWWDNAQNPGDIMDTYVSGDAAPEGRFNYRYVAGSSAPPGTRRQVD